MKYIFIILLIISGITLNAQTRPSGNPTQFNTGRAKWGWLQTDSGMIFALLDTTAYIPTYPFTTVGRRVSGDTSLYFWTGLRWKQVGSGSSAGSVTSISQGFGIVNTPNPITSTGTIKVDTSVIATTTALRDSLAAHPTLIVDTVLYTHSGAETTTFTSSELVGKEIISCEVHPFVVELTNSAPGASQVQVNTSTGVVTFGTALQDGQTVTIIFKYYTGTSIPLVTSVAINGGTPQTGAVNIPVNAINQLTGDVTTTAASGSESKAATIANQAVTYAKIQNVTGQRLLGRYSAGSGSPQEITIGSNLTLNTTTGELSATGGSGSSPKAGKSIRISGTDTVNNRVDVADSSYAVLAGVIRGLWDTATNQNNWFWISNVDHGNINIKDSVAVTGSGVSVFYDSSTYQKVVTFLIVPDETASRIAQSTASYEGKAGALFWSNGGYTAGASVGLTSSTITFSKMLELSVLVQYNGSSWVMNHPISGAINFNGAPPTITYSSGRLRIQNLPFNMRSLPDVTQYAFNGVDSNVGYKPAIEVISSTWVDIYFWDSKNNVKYTAATPPTNFGVYINFGTTFAVCSPITEDMGKDSNFWVIAIMKKSLICPIFISNTRTSIVFIIVFALVALIIVRRKRFNKFIFLAFLFPFGAKAQIESRVKSFQNLGTSGMAMYSGNTAQRPTGDFRWVRFNTDSLAFEGKIDATTWRVIGSGAGGGTLSSINSQTGPAITLAAGTAGTDFAISASSNTITFDLPTASASNRGALSSANWSTFNSKIGPSDTAAITDRSWRISGNSGSGYRLGTTSADNWSIISNNTTIGTVFSTGGKFNFGGTNIPGTNIRVYVQNGGAYIQSNSASNLVTGDDAVNMGNATNLLGIHSNAAIGTIFLTPNGASAIQIRDFGQTTPIWNWGGDNTWWSLLANPVQTSTTAAADVYTISLQPTFSPASGTATHKTLEIRPTINQAGTGITRGLYINPNISAAADFRAIDVTSGHLRISGTFAGSGGDLILVKRTDSLVGEVAQSSLTGVPNIYNANGTLSGNRTVTAGGATLTFTGINSYTIAASLIVREKSDNTVPYSEIIGTTGANDWRFAYVQNPASPGTFAKGHAIVIDTNNNVGLGNTVPTTIPLYATGTSTYVAGGLQSAAGNFYKVRNVNGDDAVTITDNWINIDASGGNVTLTLPAASALFGGTVGIRYVFKRQDASGNTVTIQRNGTPGTDTIDGAASFTIVGQYTVREVQCISTALFAIK